MLIDNLQELATFILILFGIGLAITAYLFWAGISTLAAKIDELERMY